MACRMATVAVLAGLMSGALPGATADDLCSATIVSDLTLDQDLVCPGGGLVVGADGVEIALNGHTISGAGTGVGIVLTGRNDVSIAGGTIQNFAVAVQVNTSTGIVIKNTQFVDNREGIDFQAGSIGNSVKTCAFRDSSVRAIMFRSNARLNDIKNNSFTGNRLGILVFGGVENVLKDNVISGSSLAGVRLNVLATGNVLKDNTLSANEAGIEFIVTATGWAVGNELKDNRLVANVCGIKGPTDGNTLKDNQLSGNAADTCF